MDQKEAKVLLQNLLYKQGLSYDLAIDAVMHLSEIMIRSIKLSHDTSEINQLRQLIERLETLNEENPPANIRVQALILQSKLSYLLDDINGSIVSLQHARKLAFDADLEFLKDRIDQEQIYFDENKGSLQNIVDKGKRVIHTSQELIEDYLEYIKKNFGSFHLKGN
ncbi:MAG: hypothetical protein IH840_05190 [Candidatus Heimdallarchaeota archaeon]|nr:hypothetical protein [Candidatus Heimdallarchaeota archaeon]